MKAANGVRGLVIQNGLTETAITILSGDGVTIGGLKSGTLASAPSGLVVDELWEDTTDSATHPIIRMSKTTT